MLQSPMSCFSSVKYILSNTVSMSPEPRITSLYAASKPYFGKITRTTYRRNIMFLTEAQVINEYERSNENVFFTVLFISYFLP